MPFEQKGTELTWRKSALSVFGAGRFGRCCSSPLGGRGFSAPALHVSGSGGRRRRASGRWQIDSTRMSPSLLTKPAGLNAPPARGRPLTLSPPPRSPRQNLPVRPRPGTALPEHPSKPFERTTLEKNKEASGGALIPAAVGTSDHWTRWTPSAAPTREAAGCPFRAPISSIRGTLGSAPSPSTRPEPRVAGRKICMLHVQTDTEVNSLHSSSEMLRIAAPI